MIEEECMIQDDTDVIISDKSVALILENILRLLDINEHNSWTTSSDLNGDNKRQEENRMTESLRKRKGR